jgi:hypothetical protein
LRRDGRRIAPNGAEWRALNEIKNDAVVDWIRFGGEKGSAGGFCATTMRS